MKMSEEKVTSGQSSFDLRKFHCTPTVLPSAESDFRCPVETNDDPVKWLADAMEDAVIEARQGRDDTGISADDLPKCLCVERTDSQGDITLVPSMSAIIQATFSVALGARLAQCSGEKLTFDKRNFEYIAIFVDVLGKYGKYVNQEKAYTIYPLAGAELVSDLKELGALNKTTFVIPSWYPLAMRMCRRAGIFTAYGLPKETTVDTPEMFKLTCEDGMIVGVDTGAGADCILTATLVYASSLIELFGSYRTLYTGISATRTAIEDLGYKALHNLRNA